MNGQTLESGSHLTQAGICHIQEAAAEKNEMQPLDASKLQITLTASPREVPAPNSAEVFAMKYVFLFIQLSFSSVQAFRTVSS